MKNDYRTFKLTLRTMAPVHIGSGEKYTNREFIYENKAYYFPDMGKFYSSMVEKGLSDKFESFLMEHGKAAKNNRLISFLEGNRIRERNFGGYKIKETGFEKDEEEGKKGTINEVSKFIRDGFGKPYIPGSSLKGALRTVLLNTHPQWKTTNFISEYGRIKKENKEVIPWGAERNQKFDDLFNEIRVSDSLSLKVKGRECHSQDLILVQKWDYSATAKTPKPIPLYREALPPFTAVEFLITTTSDRAAKMIEQLGSLSLEFYNSYKAFFLDEFDEQYRQANVQYPLYLGAGSGAWTKTVFKQADGILQKRYSRMPTTKMVRKGVLKLTKAPSVSFLVKGEDRRLIKNGDNFYEMGKVNFIIQEISK
ncbi:CRISPR-associated protein, Csm5 family [Streptococcus sp. DD11]|uniref:type III-A CRISPR-associated RAMP protein Csm5 n=1 Tax=Streptococcus sp. DD11 TaxID=1777879 RepID=UPI0007976398|nr:type III-A CRISPR-associated RAMP protein Csm5 [Streptococcus sp. DD11]KXT78672.1 CRISPR-associated protein, Csm5 family [Streptococcus sp. DD11]